MLHEDEPNPDFGTMPESPPNPGEDQTHHPASRERTKAQSYRDILSWIMSIFIQLGLSQGEETTVRNNLGQLEQQMHQLEDQRNQLYRNFVQLGKEVGVKNLGLLLLSFYCSRIRSLERSSKTPNESFRAQICGVRRRSLKLRLASF